MEISLPGLTLNTSTVLGNIDAYVVSLARAKAAPGHALCLCTSPSRKLVIRAVKTRLFLAVWPHDGHNHHYACPFHRDEEGASCASLTVLPAVLESSEGFEIATDFPLERVVKFGVSLAIQEPINAAELVGCTRPARTRMGLLGVIHHLWKESSLNTWASNWKRDWWRVTQALLPVIEQGKLAGRSMTECLYLVPELNPRRRTAIDRAWQQFKTSLVPNNGPSRFGLVLGEAMLMEVSKFGFRLSMRHFPPFLYFSDELRSKLAIAYPKAYHRIGNREMQHVIALCLVEISQNGNVSVVDAALMPTSKEFIPIDSSFEATLAELMVDQKRSFIKPLSARMGESVLPDFILTDTRPVYVLEVFGLNTVDYIERKIAKKALFRAEGKPVWSWEPNVTPKPPLLPSRH